VSLNLRDLLNLATVVAVVVVTEVVVAPVDSLPQSLATVDSLTTVARHRR